ncbi:MAG TPA: hypothetical protein VFD56_10960 [Chitinophagaceae bacterium]|nr:hypothetical protein [Chitinophagaceae bacterium]
MSISLLRNLCLVIFLSACASTSRNSKQPVNNHEVDMDSSVMPGLDQEQKPQSLMNLAQSQDGGFVLVPGFYEAEFKTYCLQPGTPDPSQGDAYLQGPVTGYRKDIIESVLLNSRRNPEVDQRNVQLLLWSVVSGSNFNKLSPAVQADAMKLLTPKQVFTLKGGVVGVIKTVSQSTRVFNAGNGIQRLFETGITSYESFERLAVLNEPSQIRRKGVKYDQWYKQEENYYVRYFPVSYKKVRIQVYVPDNLLDADGKRNGEYVVFDPTGQQAIPAFTNAQRLGIGTPVLDIVRVIIQVNKKTSYPTKLPEKKQTKKAPSVGK